MLEKIFKLSQHGTTVKTELLAGSTTFFAMAYIIFVNPALISGGDTQVFHGVFFATCISAAIGTIIMAFWANLPLALAPGMGANALFAFSVIPSVVVLAGQAEVDYITQYQMGLVIVFLSGILFMIVSFFGMREVMISGIPREIRQALPIGIGIFICFLGLENGQMVVMNEATAGEMVQVSEFAVNHASLLTLGGVILLVALSHFKARGGILISVAATTALAYLTGYSVVPEGFALDFGGQAKDFLEVSFLKMNFEAIFQNGDFVETLLAVIVLVVSLSLVDMFDTIGVFIGTVTKTGLLKEGDIKSQPAMLKALQVDSVATTTGALLGTSTVTSYVESATGVYEGGKTGLTSVFTGLWFLVALFLGPFISLVPSCATAPALIYVGFLMVSSVGEIDFTDETHGLPAFLTFVIIPLSGSISSGLGFGLISYVLMKTVAGKGKEVSLVTKIVAGVFLLQYALPGL